ncbi:DUF3105 domain-containing protein [Anaerolineae bacterium CFX7]|nr:DUF3105 domain-containing protein [Anaerolineae bacterium CFX7]
MAKPSRAAQAKQAEAKKQRQYLIIGGGIAAALLLGIGILYPMLQSRQPTSVGSAMCEPLQVMADEGRGHLEPGDPTPVYKSIPPTSGTHNPLSYPAGIYDKNANITELVHSLEHGYIILYYNNIPQDQLDQLVRIQQADPYKVSVVEYPNMPQKIALAAWGNLQNCEGVNEQVIRSFVAQFRDHGPEAAP